MGLVGGDADRSASVDSAAMACIQPACVTPGNPAQLAIKVPSPLPTCSQDKLMIAIREENTHYDASPCNESGNPTNYYCGCSPVAFVAPHRNPTEATTDRNGSGIIPGFIPDQ